MGGEQSKRLEMRKMQIDRKEGSEGAYFPHDYFQYLKGYRGNVFCFLECFFPTSKKE